MKTRRQLFRENKHTEAIWLRCYMDEAHRPRLGGQTSTLAHLDRLIPVLHDLTRKALQPRKKQNKSQKLNKGLEDGILLVARLLPYEPRHLEALNKIISK